MTEHLGEVPGVPGPGSPLAALRKSAWQVLLVASIVAIVLGVWVLAWPSETLRVVGVLFGIYLVISGVLQLAAAFGPHVPGAMRALQFVTGALSVLLGLICFRGAAESLLLLALWIGFGWLMRGLMMLGIALYTEGMPGRGWQAFFGGITLVAGVVMIVLPFHSLAVLTLITGLWLLVLGVAELIHAFHLRSLANRRPPAPPHAPVSMP
jgi:uncharacterized membrane protein HdeD (DUF308 family)